MAAKARLVVASVNSDDESSSDDVDLTDGFTNKERVAQFRKVHGKDSPLALIIYVTVFVMLIFCGYIFCTGELHQQSVHVVKQFKPVNGSVLQKGWRGVLVREESDDGQIRVEFKRANVTIAKAEWKNIIVKRSHKDTMLLVMGVFFFLTVLTVLFVMWTSDFDSAFIEMRRQHGLDSKETQLIGSRFLLVAPLGLLMPIAGIIALLAFPGTPLHRMYSTPWWMHALSDGGFICFAVSSITLVFQSLFRPVILSYRLIEHIIHSLDNDYDIDWDAKCDQVQSLDDDLEKIWRVAGGATRDLVAVIAACATVCGFGVVLLLMGLQDNDMEARNFWSGLGTVWFVAAAIFLAVVLYPVASITSMCQDTTAKVQSLPAAAWRYPNRVKLIGRTMSPEERAAHSRFTSFLDRNVVGCQVLGMFITKGMIITHLLKVVIVVPTAFKILRDIMGKLEQVE